MSYLCKRCGLWGRAVDHECPKPMPDPTPQTPGDRVVEAAREAARAFQFADSQERVDDALVALVNEIDRLDVLIGDNDA